MHSTASAFNQDEGLEGVHSAESHGLTAAGPSVPCAPVRLIRVSFVVRKSPEGVDIGKSTSVAL